jgi:enoyl-CoA hydratase/carnithine racemase
MEAQEVLGREITGHVGTLTFNRPQKRNALSAELLVKLHVTLKEWAAEDRIRAVVITGGNGKIFSSGYDIMAIPTQDTPELMEIVKQQNPVELALRSVKEFPYPTIAMLNGDAFGAGLNLCMCCDIRIAADDIKVAMPPAKLGVVYHPEGLKQFIEVLGMASTREMFLTARTYQGAELLEKGLVDHLLPRAELAATTYRLADEIASRAPLSLKGTKRILNMLGASLVLTEEGLQEAERLVTEALNSRDLAEARAAFIEKRKPSFVGS